MSGALCAPSEEAEAARCPYTNESAHPTFECAVHYPRLTDKRKIVEPNNAAPCDLNLPAYGTHAMLAALRRHMEVVLQNHSSYPRPLSIDETPQQLMLDVLRDQEEAGLDMITDGQIHWADPIAHIMHALDGVRLDDVSHDPHMEMRARRPVITAPVRRRAPIVHDDFVRASAAARAPVKPVLTGPYTLARASLIEAGVYRDWIDLAHALSGVLAAEVRDLAQAGARMIQVEEPAILAHPDDFRLLRQLLEPLWAARGAAQLLVATYRGDAAPLYAQLHSLPADIVAFDLASDPQLRQVIADTGGSQLLALGVVDGRNPQLEDPSTIARSVEAMLKHYVLDQVHLLPSCGLASLRRECARAKLGLLATARQLMAGG
jgi:5-methyltetrahydropteroyltriglutamate--homocysteine methyltransferase